MGLVNLDYFPNVVDANAECYRTYSKALADVNGIRLIPHHPATTPNYQYVVVEMEQGEELRDRIIMALHAENVLARKYFWPGCHRMKPYRDLFPHSHLFLNNTEQCSKRIIVLPTGESMTNERIESVSNCIRHLVSM